MSKLGQSIAERYRLGLDDETSDLEGDLSADDKKTDKTPLALSKLLKLLDQLEKALKQLD